jgi:hypothetical protein
VGVSYYAIIEIYTLGWWVEGPFIHWSSVSTWIRNAGKDKLKSRMQRNKESAAASRERARFYTHSLELKVAALEDT